MQGIQLGLEQVFCCLVISFCQVTLKSRDFLPHFLPFFFVLSFYLFQLLELLALFMDSFAALTDVRTERLFMPTAALRTLWGFTDRHAKI